MRKVLITTHKFFPDHRAGTEVLTLRIARDLQRRGYEVLVVTGNPPDVDARRREGPDTSDYEYEGIPVHVIEEPLRLRGYEFSFEYRHPHIARHFAGIVSDFKPDILQVVHAQNLSGAIVEVARDAGVPVVFYATDFWFVCPIVQLKRPDGSVCRGPGPFNLKCLDCYTPKLFPPKGEFKEALEEKVPAWGNMRRSMPIPFAELTTGALHSLYLAKKGPAAIKATLERPYTLREIANRMQAILVPTKLLRDVFVENGIEKKLIKHVPFGIDLDGLVPYQEKTSSRSLRVGFIGTLFEHKGVDLLIKAFLALPEDKDAELLIYGDTSQFPEYGRMLLSMADDGSANSKKIKFKGTFPQAQFGEVLSNLDVLVVPSRWYENTPLVIQSALATRTPLIATNLGGMAELIENEVNGLLFALNDAGDLSAQLLKVLCDRSLIEKFRQNIKPERSIAEMVDDIEGVYESVLACRTVNFRN